MLKEAKYERKGKVIKNLEAKSQKDYESINQAKRHSRELQMSEDGALGRGSLRTIK